MGSESGLVSRRIAFETDDAVTIIEVWDTSHPDSPWVEVWPPRRPQINPHIRAVTFTRAQYDELKPALKPPSAPAAPGE